ncbi:MAG: sugar phosphate isomerase/epimerase [Bryobacterales bacterium]|nr:sugar phosphate isomerase/epimerase [Bryobacterales bacterium]
MLVEGNPVPRQPGTRVRIGLNAYSFNVPLRSGEMTLPDVVDFCAANRLDCLDATGYYFPGYPAVPPDRFLYDLKRRAFLNGVTINGTGVRNDFALTDAARRAGDLQLVKNWIGVASKLGASVIRVFSGSRVPEGHSFDQTLEWMAPLLRECASTGKEHGVMIGLQNHNDFVKSAAETIRVVEAVDSDWLGVILDVGSLRMADPYEEIEKLLPYAISWQLKESLWHGGKEVATDLRKLKAIIERGGYRGFVPIETLGEGDPRARVAKFAREVHEVFGG